MGKLNNKKINGAIILLIFTCFSISSCNVEVKKSCEVIKIFNAFYLGMSKSDYYKAIDRLEAEGTIKNSSLILKPPSMSLDKKGIELKLYPKFYPSYGLYSINFESVNKSDVYSLWLLLLKKYTEITDLDKLDYSLSSFYSYNTKDLENGDFYYPFEMIGYKKKISLKQKCQEYLLHLSSQYDKSTPRERVSPESLYYSDMESEIKRIVYNEKGNSSITGELLGESNADFKLELKNLLIENELLNIIKNKKDSLEKESRTKRVKEEEEFLKKL